MIKIPPPRSLISDIDIVNTPYPIHKMRSRCLNCSDRAASDCFGCISGRQCEFYSAACEVPK